MSNLRLHPHEVVTARLGPHARKPESSQAFLKRMDKVCSQHVPKDPRQAKLDASIQMEINTKDSRRFYTEYESIYAYASHPLSQPPTPHSRPSITPPTPHLSSCSTFFASRTARSTRRRNSSCSKL